MRAPRNRIVRRIGGLEHSRRPATRCDRTAASLLGFTDLARIRSWVRAFAGTARLKS